MSAIPSSAIPHTYAHEDENLRDLRAGAPDPVDGKGRPSGLLIAGAAVAGYLLYRMIR